MTPLLRFKQRRGKLGLIAMAWVVSLGIRPLESRRFSQTNSEFLARWRALFFRQGGGSKSEARNLLCPKIQKEFLPFF